MRLLSTTFLVSTLLFASTGSAVRISRREHPPSSSLVVSSRQHHVPRTILDICVNVNVDLLTDVYQLLGLDLDLNIPLCLCLKDLDIFLDTNVNIKALVGLLGKGPVSALITALINTSPNASQCSFPPHAHHTCNNYGPCHYECDPHYVRVGDTCVCAPPYTSCNGVCDAFPKGCGSAIPQSLKARGPITTIAQAKATCKPHETPCGIPGREDTLDFECINIDTADDSCGGCMAPQPFFEAHPVRYVSGTDCTRISNAKISKCSGGRCIVSKCKAGWIPNLARDTCIIDSDGPPKLRKASKRPVAINVTANANIGSDLVVKIGAIINLVSDLKCHLSPSEVIANSCSSAAVIFDLFSNVSSATSTLVASTTVPSLLNNLDSLLNLSSHLCSTISSCGNWTDLGLSDLEDGLNNIVVELLNLKNWCAENVLTGLNLSSLLSGLSLDNPTVAVDAVVSPDLVDQIKSLVSLVVGLAGVSSYLPPPSPGSGSIPTSPLATGSSLINTNIINSIINATVDVVNAPTVTSLISGINALVNASGLASSLLDDCGCVITMGLGPLVGNLAQVVNVTLEMKDWCDTHPVARIPQAPAAGGSGDSSSTFSNTDELIDVGLSDLLGLLGPVESSVTVSGSGTDTGTLANGLLVGLRSGRLVTSDVSAAGADLNPELVIQLEGLVKLVTELEASCSLYGPTSFDAPDLMADIVEKTANLLGSSSVVSLVNNIDALVTANSALQTALTNYTCINGIVDYLVRVTNAILGLKDSLVVFG